MLRGPILGIGITQTTGVTGNSCYVMLETEQCPDLWELFCDTGKRASDEISPWKERPPSAWWSPHHLSEILAFDRWSMCHLQSLSHTGESHRAGAEHKIASKFVGGISFLQICPALSSSVCVRKYLQGKVGIRYNMELFSALEMLPAHFLWGLWQMFLQTLYCENRLCFLCFMAAMASSLAAARLFITGKYCMEMLEM